MHDLFFGYGVAHTILLLAFVIGIGLYLGRFKVKGISLGSTWILFMGILMGHLGFGADLSVLHFVKEFGLILFVFSIGLQVGPGFFHSFRSGGVKMNLLAVMNILLAVAVTYAISAISGEDLSTMVGVMSGAVTNTPGLGAAQQTFADVSAATGSSVLAAGTASEKLASAYAVAYPMGVIGVIMVIGLVAKNAILIVEFAKMRRDKGMDAVKAALESANLRLRPIIMTSLAFIIGCIPLAIATGAGAASRNGMGVAVVGGMLFATSLGIFLIPVFYVMVEKIAEKLKPSKKSE